jgi:hypothetical protein
MNMRVWMEAMKASPVVNALNWHQVLPNNQEPLTRENNEKGMSMVPTRMSAAARLASRRFVRVRMPLFRAIVATTRTLPTMDAKLIWSTTESGKLNKINITDFFKNEASFASYRKCKLNIGKNAKRYEVYSHRFA